MIIDKIKNLFQKQDNILHCYTPNSAVYEFGEIEVAKKCLPSWWKELPSTYQHKPYVFQNSSSSNVFSQFKAPITTPRKTRKKKQACQNWRKDKTRYGK